MKSTRIAIAGLGKAAREIHLPAYAKIPSLQVVGGFDPAISSGNYSFPLFPSAQEMLDKTKPEILAIVVPPVAHCELARLGLQAGCHVFCEKPFMPTLEEAHEVCDLSKKLGRWVVVNNQYRFMNIHAEAKRRIGSSDFGDLLFLGAQQTFYTSEETEAGWRGEDPQRTCKEFGIHVLDLCRFFYGEDPRLINARMPKPGAGDGAGPDYLDLIQLEFSRDRVAQITLDRLCRGPHRYLTMHLDGSAGYIETHLGGGIELSAGVRGGKRKPYVNFDVSLGGRARLYHGEKFQKIAKDPIDIFASATSKLLQALLDAIENNTTPPCSADDNRRTLALMLAAYESSARRQPVDMKY
ncbi:MAG TPA: Gfo/Idh/MocA family oxidoreductase [Tepidisphaeraceae bacterium]|jgi:predicted dehydrogenase